jgi:hypothetical protein
MILSKSLYTFAIQYPKVLWLKKYNSKVLTPPDENTLAIFDTRNRVGMCVVNFLIFLGIKNPSLNSKV